MAWRNILSAIVDASLDYIAECIDGEPSACAERLIASADALYSPLKPIDSGFGEARRIASALAAIIANSFIIQVEEKKGVEAEDFLKKVAERLEEIKGEKRSLAGPVLEKAGSTVIEAAFSPEARESLVKDILEYVEPPQPNVWKRRRRIQPRRPDPRQRLKRLLRELGRTNPIFAREITQLLRSRGLL